MEKHRAYDNAVRVRGGQLWSEDYEKRYELWKRRYQRPAPPEIPA